MITKEYTGWKCPQCNGVYAPHVDECKNCKKPPTMPQMQTLFQNSCDLGQHNFYQVMVGIGWYSYRCRDCGKEMLYPRETH